MATGCITGVKSKYRCVRGISKVGSEVVKWCVNIKGVGRNGFDTEREAAIAVDKYLIKKGKNPVNILTKMCK